MAQLAPSSLSDESPEGQTQREREARRALYLTYGHNSLVADRGPVLVSICPDSGRCVVVYSPLDRAENSEVPWVVDEDTGEILVDPEREAYLALENRRRALRRSRSRLADFCVANRLTKMWTLTIRGEPEWARDRRQFKEHVEAFFKKWRRREGKPFPYAYVLELQKRGVWHAHVLVPPDFYTDFFLLSRMWGWGYAQYEKSIKDDGSRRAARRAASYLSKYLSKDWERSLEPGEHRYEVAQGFQPARASIRFRHVRDARQFLDQIGGYHLAFASADDLCWTGPPVEVYYNDDDVGAQAA